MHRSPAVRQRAVVHAVSSRGVLAGMQAAEAQESVPSRLSAVCGDAERHVYVLVVIGRDVAPRRLDGCREPFEVLNVCCTHVVNVFFFV